MSSNFSRKALVVGFSLAGLGGIMLPSLGQGADDAKKAAAPAAAAPAVPPAVIGAIDLDRVFKDYEKVKDQSEKFKGEAMKRQQELTRLVESGKSAAATLEKLKPNSPDYAKWDNEVTKIQAELQAKQQAFQKEFSKKESETLANLYNEVSQMTSAVARQRKLTFVVKISSEPVQGDDPQTVMAAMAKTIVFNDPSADITNDVIRYLNYNYEKTKATTDAQATPASATAPAPAATKAAPAVGAAPKGSIPR